MPKIFHRSTKIFDLNKVPASQSSPPQFLHKGFLITVCLDVVSCFNLQSVSAKAQKHNNNFGSELIYGMKTFNFIGVHFLPAIHTTSR